MKKGIILGVLGFLLSCTLVFAQPGPYSKDEYTIALYHLDEKEGNLISDSSGYENHGRRNPSYASWSKEGRFGGCLKLRPRKKPDERQTSVRISQKLFDPNNFTIEMWFKLADLDHDHYLIGCKGGKTGRPWFFSRFQTVGKFICTAINTASGTWQAGTSTVGNIVKPKTWYHLAVTCNGREIKVYLNGALEAKKDISQIKTVIPDDDVILVLGSAPWHTKQVWTDLDGEIDEIRVSNIARSF